jgi:uncharacterized OB-fold protein
MTDLTERPVREGLFRNSGDGPTLLGKKCTACGHVEFPGGKICTSCLAEAPAEIELSRDGELFCETTVHMRSPNFAAPYRVGYVRLPEGLMLFAPLRPIEGRPLTVAARMRLELAPLWQHEGVDVIGYRFYPL